MLDIIEKREFWTWLDNGWGNLQSYDLKGIQDAYIISHLHNIRGKRILEVGGGNSRVLKTLAEPERQNECWNAEKFEGFGGGPTQNVNKDNIRSANCFLGEFSAELPDEYFDYVFSVSVIEHVPSDQLDNFFADCARILKVGGLMLHAIDIYIFDADTNVPHREYSRTRLRQYLSFANRPDLGLEMRDAPSIDEDLSFTCRFASNSDQAMNKWNHFAPDLKAVREIAQVVSIKAEWSKNAATSRPISSTTFVEIEPSLPTSGKARNPGFSIITPSLTTTPKLAHIANLVASQQHVSVEHIICLPEDSDTPEIDLAGARKLSIIDSARGLAYMIAQGMAQAQGEIIAWLPADARYADEAVLAAVAARFAQSDAPDIVYGLVEGGGETTPIFNDVHPDLLCDTLLVENCITGAGVFIHRRFIQQLGAPHEDYGDAFEYEYYLRAAKLGARWAFLDRVLAYHQPTAPTEYTNYLKASKVHFGFVSYAWARRQAALHSEPETLSHTRMLHDIFTHYNTDYVALELLRQANEPSAAYETSRVMQTLGVSMEHPARPAEEVTFAGTITFPREGDAERPGHSRRYSVTAVDGAQLTGYMASPDYHWLFDSRWVDTQLIRARSFIENRRYYRRTDVCVVVGNGPSLNLLDLSLLPRADVIISNFAYYKPELLAASTYHTIVNHYVAEQANYEVNALQNVTKVYPYWLGVSLNADDHTYFLDTVARPEFSTDVTDWSNWWSTVSYFNLHLAYSLGYRKVLLIGFDHNYEQPKEAVDGDLITQDSDDVNHFDSRYFRGKVWQAADTDQMALRYQISKEAYEKDGREIINCSVGGKLEVFERGILSKELDAAEQPRVLILDMTVFGGALAAGELKEILFHGYARRQMLHIFSPEPQKLGIDRFATSETPQETDNFDHVLEICRKFYPDVIYFRPLPERPVLNSLAQQVIDVTGAPVVCHITNDWINQIQHETPQQYLEFDAFLRWLFDQAQVRMTTDSSIAEAYKERYGYDFIPLANAAHPDEGQQSEAFRHMITRAAAAYGWRPARSALTSDENLVGGYSREQKARFDEMRLVHALLPKAGVMFDVGAHTGTALKPFAAEGWRVIAFEPDPTNRRELHKFVDAMPNVTVDPRALSDQPAQDVSFYASEESTGIGSLRGFTEQHREVTRVDVTTLAQALTEHNISAVDFLKIDTEGYDLAVLKGLPWEQVQPRIVVCEFEDSKTKPLGYDFHTLAQFLTDQGYTVLVSEWHPIIRYGIVHDWRRLVPYPCHLSSTTAWGNLIAFRDKPDLSQIKRLVQHYLIIGGVKESVKNLSTSQDVSQIHTASPSGSGNFQTRVNLLLKRLQGFYIGRLRWFAVAFIVISVLAALDTPLSPLLALLNAIMLLALLGHVATRPPRQ